MRHFNSKMAGSAVLISFLLFALPFFVTAHTITTYNRSIWTVTPSFEELFGEGPVNGRVSTDANGGLLADYPYYGLGRNCFAVADSTMTLSNPGTNFNTTIAIGGLYHELGHGSNLPHNRLQTVTQKALGISLMSFGNSTRAVDDYTVTSRTDLDCAILNRNEVFNNDDISYYGPKTGTVSSIYAFYNPAKQAIVITGTVASTGLPIISVGFHNDRTPDSTPSAYDAAWSAPVTAGNKFYIEEKINDFVYHDNQTYRLELYLTQQDGEAAHVPYDFSFVNGVPVLTPATPPLIQFYVDDNSDIGDIYTPGATGDDATGDGTSTKPYRTIAKALSMASAGNTIFVDAGTYTEQVEVTKGITIIGAGSATIIASPATLPLSYTLNGNPHKPIVYVHDAAGVTIKKLTVDGLGNGNANNRFEGIAYRNAGGTVDSCRVKTIRNNPIDGVQGGVAIYAYADNGTSQVLYVKHDTLVDFQKNATVFGGANLTANVDSNIITGAGSVAFIAQNGVQVSGGAGGTVTNNTISGFNYTPNTVTAAGILVFGPGVVQTSGNTLNDAQIGIFYSGSGGSITNNIVNYSAANMGSTPYWYGIDVNNGTFTVTGNEVNGGGNGAGIEADAYDGETTTITATNNKVNNTDEGFVVYTEGSGIANSAIHNNSITGSITKAIHNYSSTTADATCNWYGTSDGTVIASKIAGPVTYEPWLTSGTDTDPAVGFQPTASCNGTANDNDGDGIPNANDCAPLDPGNATQKPKLTSTINNVTIVSNNDGVDDQGAFTVANTTNNIVFGSFTDQNGATGPMVKAYQVLVLTNATTTLCNNCSAPLTDFNGGVHTVSLVNADSSGTMLIKYREFIDANSNGQIDAGECFGDQVVYTVTINGNSTPCATDSTPPVITPRNITVYLDASGHASISRFDVIQSVTDNCSLDSASIHISDSSFSCSDVAASSSPASNNHLAYVASTSSGVQAHPGELGMEFQVNNPQGIRITQLGAFDHQNNGIIGSINGGVRVAIFNKASRTIVAGLDTVISGASDTLVANHRLKNITPVTLLPGSYVIVTKGYNSSELNGNAGVGSPVTPGDNGNAAISYTGSGLYGTSTSGFGYPDQTDGGPAVRYLAGTFRFDVLAGGGGTPTNDSTPHLAYVASTSNGVQAHPGELGMEFQVNNPQGIRITQLGAFDHQNNGIIGSINGGVRVAIFNKASRTIVAGLDTVISGASDTLVANHRLKNITPVTLLPGSYVIVTKGYNSSELNGNAGVGSPVTPGDNGNAAISYTGSGLYGTSTSGFGYPDQTDGGPAVRYLAGTFRFVTLSSGSSGGGSGASTNHVAYVAGTATGTQAYSGELGMEFQVNNAKGIRITQLGAFDHQSNGIIGGVRVAIFNKASRSIVAGLDTLISGASDTLIANHRFRSISPVTLLPGSYVIVAKGYNSSELHGNAGAGSPVSQGDNAGGAITFTGSGLYGSAGGGAFSYPLNEDGGPAYRYQAGSFRYDVLSDSTSGTGSKQVTITAADVKGNMSTAMATVTVRDTLGACKQSSTAQSQVKLPEVERASGSALWSSAGAVARLYPNPSRGRLSVELVNMQAGRVVLEVLNLEGRVITVRVVELEGKRVGDVIVPFDLSGQPSGVYIVRIRSKEGLQSLKVVVAR